MSTMVSYDQLREQVSAVADAFASAGIEPGDRIAMSLPNGLHMIVCFLAASIAGTAAPLNPNYRYEEFLFFLQDTNAKLLVVPPQGADEARRAAAVQKVPVITAEVKGGVVELSPRARGKTATQPHPDAVALILHTSGSTGRPKRVPLRHRNLTASGMNIVSTYGLTPGDIALVAMPLFHIHGLVASTLSTLLSGGTVIVPSKFNPLSFSRTAHDYRVTWYSAVPTIHSFLLALGERPGMNGNLRFIRSCSAPLSPAMMNDLETAFGSPVIEAYGMTEASHQVASNPLPPDSRKPGYVGLGTGVKIGIMDGAGNLLPSGTAGEVVIQGPNVIDGYENNPDANAASFTNGWFRTGDQGVLDSESYLQLIGRIKELIIRGGEKISPREIDEVLLAHPAIAEAVCFGVPHPTWGEEVAAAIVLRSTTTESEVLAFCRERLADFKRPKRIHIVQEIPRTATGKVRRSAVADTFGGKTG
jgi:acyl-CoA synthetase (AMP-forming)/AMP-acid ligase II